MSAISYETATARSINEDLYSPNADEQSLELPSDQPQPANRLHVPVPGIQDSTSPLVHAPEEIDNRTSTPRALSTSTLCSIVQTVSLGEARTSLSSGIDTGNELKDERYASYVQLLQPLIAQLRTQGLLNLLGSPSNSPAAFYEHGFKDYIQEFGHDDEPIRISHLPLDITVSEDHVSPSPKFTSSWLVTRLELVFARTSAGVEQLRPSTGTEGLETLFAAVERFMNEFHGKNPKVQAFIGRSGLWFYFNIARVTFICDGYRAALGGILCDCHMCTKLRQLLVFYHYIEAFQLYAAAAAYGRTVDHTCLKVFVARTNIVPSDRDAINTLHKRLLTLWDLHRVQGAVGFGP